MQGPNKSKQSGSGSGNPLVQPGALDGVTIMRYAHIYRDRTSGGTEQYLRRLHRGLLERHRLTILQMHLVNSGTSETIEIENVGLGRILWVPVPLRPAASIISDLPNRMAYIYRRALRACQQKGRKQSNAVVNFLHSLWRHYGGHLLYSSTILSDHLSYLLTTYDVDLLAVHWATYDTRALVTHAIKIEVPFVFINHFENARLSSRRRPGWIARAAGIAGVSSQGIPKDIQDRYVKLADAVDTEFFDPQKSRAVRPSAEMLVLLPARVTPGKGHQDLLRVAGLLASKHSQLVLGFVGAVDSERLHQELRRSSEAMGLHGRVRFLGEKNAEEIRDLYSQSTIVVLPSYSEGLGRVLLEGQAMKRPVVTYDSGGTVEAILPNITGFLVKAGDVETLADKVSFLLGNETERKVMGERGREFVTQEFSVSALVERHEAFYLAALSGSPKRKKIAFSMGGECLENVRPRTEIRRPVGIADSLVSILIPAYNAQEYIAETIRSALAQTWQRKEIIIVDDGSTDQTLAIARKFESDCLRVFTQPNQGAAAARNKALSLSQGDYIQWLDADDLLAPNKIARQLEAAEDSMNKRTLLSSAWGLFIYRSSRARFDPTALWCDLSPVAWLLRKMGLNLYMQTASWLVSRELSEGVGPWNTRLLGDDDGEYFCRVLLASDGVQFIPGARVYYRGPALAFRSLSYIGRSNQKLDAHWFSMRLHVSYLRSLEDSYRVRAACLNYLQMSLIYFFPERQDILRQMEEMAGDLGGTLSPPHLSWKYSWMGAVLGLSRAKRGQQLMLKARWSVEKLWDKALFHVEDMFSLDSGGFSYQKPSDNF